jgi:ubiquinone/menaquinone biosynthesis C-methylase UbiE
VEPRVYERDGFVITLWTYYEPVPPGEVAPAEYARALGQLHAGMQKLDDVTTPHFTDRVAEAQQLVASRDHTPALADADRQLLGDTLRNVRRAIGERSAAEQLLHGEPHPGNLLSTKNGPLFIDLETCCRGPVEFDLAHAPEEVGKHYPGADQDLLRECRLLVLAMVATWRWDRGDQFPNGQRAARELLSALREGPPWPTPDVVTRRHRGFDAATIRSAYESVADEYAATFVDDLADLELDRRILDIVADHSTGVGPVLDVGCGPAQVSGYLLERQVETVGIDFTPAMLAVARRRIPQLRVAIGDLRALPVRAGSVAGVVAFYVLHHGRRAELGTTLREVRRVLARDGLFATAFHEGDGEFQVGSVTATRYGAEELSEQLANASLVVQTVDRRAPLPHEHQGDRCYIVARAT